MDKQVKIVSLGNASFCLISDNNDWKQGNAYDTVKKELFYYNGEYGEVRPLHIKQVVAQPNEIGWVRNLSENSSFVSKFEDVMYEIIPALEYANGKCLMEELKINGRYVIKLYP